ncbi:response regulator transcription factor [Gordonia rubripertincta]|uniref:LuxR C-terminal-related transcriptional regulator n=1 Tax=Gordonia rubripertincta TaxID=36822 RepID=A0ABT4MVJ4_GORRU|nr:LuxR C-terminal-related transcriptional regulator [Gordonia rubripertincta]MCZ4551030.1 LuxR C-terminal-related transcriptional regulator [Gordonia rubripertincta]
MRDYERIFRVLAAVEVADCLSDFKSRLLESLGQEFNLRHTTCFTGSTYGSLFLDQNPLLSGRTVSMIREYRSGWNEYDVFRLPEARARLERASAISVAELKDIPEPTRDYLNEWLGGQGIANASTIYLRHRNGHSLVGLFSEDSTSVRAEMKTLRLLARQLSVMSRDLPDADAAKARTESLSRRQQEVADLVTRGLTNAEIAAALVLAEDTVKKHVSQILAATGCRSRTELALYFR